MARATPRQQASLGNTPVRRRIFWRACMALIGMILFGLSIADVPGSEDLALSLKAQEDRARIIYERGRLPHYTQTFDLSGL